MSVFLRPRGGTRAPARNKGKENTIKKIHHYDTDRQIHSSRCKDA